MRVSANAIEAVRRGSSIWAQQGRERSNGRARANKGRGGLVVGNAAKGRAGTIIV